MATLGVMFGGSAFALRGGEKKTQTTPPLNAESKDEEKFIQSDPCLRSADPRLTITGNSFSKSSRKIRKPSNRHPVRRSVMDPMINQEHYVNTMDWVDCDKVV